jgi:hypothetical protein
LLLYFPELVFLFQNEILNGFLNEKNVDTYIRRALKPRTAIYPQKKPVATSLAPSNEKHLKC